MVRYCTILKVITIPTSKIREKEISQDTVSDSQCPQPGIHRLTLPGEGLMLLGNAAICGLPRLRRINPTGSFRALPGLIHILRSKFLGKHSHLVTTLVANPTLPRRDRLDFASGLACPGIANLSRISCGMYVRQESLTYTVLHPILSQPVVIIRPDSVVNRSVAIPWG